MSKEEKFYKPLQDIFIGAQIKGKSGFAKYKGNFQLLLQQHLDCNFDWIAIQLKLRF